MKTPGILIPTADAQCVLVSDNEILLKPYFRFLLLGAKQVKKLVSKRDQIELAQNLGLTLPGSWFPETKEEIEHVTNEVNFPCIAKPYHSQNDSSLLSEKKLLVIDSKQDLLDHFAGTNGSSIPLMVQEIIPGPDTELVSYLGFWD